MTSHLRFLLLCLVALAGARPLAAQPHTYLIGYNEGSVFHEQAIDRLRMVYARLGLEVQFVPLPSKRSLVDANAGVLDGDVARVPSIQSSYDQLVRVNEPLLYLQGVAYTTRRDLKRFDRRQLEDFNIGHVRGVRWAEDALRGYHPVTVYSYNSLFKMLARGRLDLVFATESSGDPIIAAMGSDAHRIIKLAPVIFSGATHHYVHRDNRHLVPKLEAAIRELRREQQWQ